MIKPDTIYVLNKYETIIAVFNKDDEDTLIDPEIEETQNKESTLTFQINAKSKKWKDIYNPENLYLAEGIIFSAEFSDSIERKRTEDDEDILTIIAYSREKLLSREYARVWNSETGFENIDDFMIVILSNGDLDLKNNGTVIETTYPKGSSGYVLEGLLYGTGWKVGICDIYEYENGELVKDENNNPIYLKFDFETDQISIYENIQKVQELWGGILIFDTLNKIVYHRDETRYLPYSGFEVKYQKNLVSSEYIGDNKIITELCPLGEGSLNIKSVNDNSIWLKNYSYTNTILKSIENNPDIYEAKQLKKWGERKLATLCKPRKELTCSIAILNSTEGYKVEEINLNDIVDVIDFEYIENKTEQLRVISYRHKIWDKSDAEVVIGDITLETTDIFKKNVSATNMINNGTVGTNRIVDYYKNGQSLAETLRQVDQTIIKTKSELSKADDQIRASVEEVTLGIDNLNNEVVTQSNRISSLELDLDSIDLMVKNTIDITSELQENNPLFPQNCMMGNLQELHIYGNNNVFGPDIERGKWVTYKGNDTIKGSGYSRIIDENGKSIIETSKKVYTNFLNIIWGNELKCYYDYDNDKGILQLVNGIKTYTFSRTMFNNVFRIATYDENPVDIVDLTPINFINNDNQEIITITIEENELYLGIYYYNEENSDYSGDNAFSDLMHDITISYLETEFIKDDTLLKIYAKNLIPTNEEEWENGYYDFNTGKKYSSLYALCNKKLIEFPELPLSYNNNLCFSIDSETYIINAFVLFDKNKNVISKSKYYSNDRTKVYIDDISDISYFACNLTFKSNTIIESSEITNIKPQVELGSIERTDFQEYIEPQKIDLYELNDKSYVTANLDKNDYHFNTGLLECKSIILLIEPNTEYIVTKIASSRFALGTFSTYPINNSIASVYVSDENEGEGLTELSITSGINDYYLVIFFYDENNDTIDLETIKESLIVRRQYEPLRSIESIGSDETSTIIRDELIVTNGKKYIYRRISRDGNTILTNPEIEYLGLLNLTVYKTKNLILLPYDDAYMRIKYVKINEYTTQFATSYEVEASLKILSNAISLLVKQTIKDNEVIAAINLAIENGQGIIRIKGNAIEIKTVDDRFHLTEEGDVKAISGEIAGFQIFKKEWDENKIYNNFINIFDDNGTTKMQGLISAEMPIYNIGAGQKDISPFLFTNAIGDGKSDIGDFTNAYFILYSNGFIDMKCTSGSSKYKENLTDAYIRIKDTVANVETVIGSSLVDAYYVIAGDGGKKGTCMHGYNFDHYYWCNWTGSWFTFYADGVAVANATTSTSDKRLKEDIDIIPNEMLELIEFIDIKKFKIKDMDNIRFGIIAQDLIEKANELNINIFDYQIINQQQIFVDDKTLYYQIDYEQFLILKSKVLENKLKKQEQITNALLNKLGLTLKDLGIEEN